VLALLLELNKQHAEQEQVAGPATVKRKAGRRKAATSADQMGLF
jgi:hypothetical protein